MSSADRPMPRCHLELALERKDARFRAGETVRGSLQVSVVDDCTSNGLAIDMCFRTQGKGDVDERWMHALPLAGGETWKAGETRSYPFEIRAPSGPVGYDGQLVQLRWFLAARASLAWALGAKHESEFFLLRAPDPEAEPEPESFRGYREPARRSPPSRCGSPAVRRTLVFPLSKTWAEWLMGAPEVTVEPSEPRPGGKVHVRVVLEPRRRVRLRAVWAEVTAEERAKESSGESWTTHRQIVQRLRVELAPDDGVMLDAAERRTFEAELQLRPDAPPSFKLNNNELQWSAVVCVDAEGVPDWKEEYDLTVA
jgi:hypothetical protein